ncbi:MAG: 50S ribosomal protein L11 methyltransferase [Myxococcota bacterium]
MTPRYPYLHVDVPSEESENISAELWDWGAQGIEERDASTIAGPEVGVTLVAYFEELPAAESARAHFAQRFNARIEFVVGDAWRDAWRDYFHPTRVGARLVVKPSWEPYAPLPQDVVITIDPGRAFGSGIHETTRLCLRELDRWVVPGQRVLDVGCGSGILAVAAALLGAEALAIDNDDDALPVARGNAENNRVAERVTVDNTPVDDVQGEFPLVVANIEARVLTPLADAIRKRVAPGGILILSGVLRGQETEICDAFAPLVCILLPFENEWLAPVLRAPER